MAQFRKKPVVIEAWQWKCERQGELRGVCNCYQGNWGSHLHTMHEGQIVMLEHGDWIIPEPDGEHYYPCKPDVFANTYDPVDSVRTQPEKR